MNSEAQAYCIFRCNIRELSNIAEGRGWNGGPPGVEAADVDGM
jgi:hypothetical protein